MHISVFQAITIFIKNNLTDESCLSRVLPLYLRGVLTVHDQSLLDEILQAECLRDFTVVDDLGQNVHDPSRHFFESMLACESLAGSLDIIDSQKLKALYDEQFDRMDEYFKTHVPETVFKNRNLHVVSGRNLGEEEYAQVIAELKSEDGVEFLRPRPNLEDAETIYNDRKKKLLLLVKAAFCSVICVQLNDNEYPIAIYFSKNGPFDAQNRGRTPRQHDLGLGRTSNNTALRSQSYGIMRTSMPLYFDSPLLAAKSFAYNKPTDRSTFVEGSAWVTKVQSQKVHTFINSISGTLLMQLRMTKKLLNEGKYPFSEDPRQFHTFHKLFICSLLYLSGGHCLAEWCGVFELPEVKAAFAQVPGFASLSIEGFFLNEPILKKVINETIEYNDRLFEKHQLNGEIRPACA